MYRFRLSGTDDDGLPDYDARRAEAEKVYESFLRGLDLSDAGDLLLFFGPAVGLSFLQISEGLGQLAGLLIGGLFSLACAIVPLWLVRGRVPLLNEE
jgi:hypothetical protein